MLLFYIALSLFLLLLMSFSLQSENIFCLEWWSSHSRERRHAFADCWMKLEKVDLTNLASESNKVSTKKRKESNQVFLLQRTAFPVAFFTL